MITVQLNEPDFEYDIHSLVKAFYPQHDVLVKAMPREEFPESEFHLEINYDREKGDVSYSFFKPQRENCPDNPGGEQLALSGAVSVDFTDRKETKNELKQKLYHLLTQFSGKTLPWGTLTGIRPTKIPMEMLEHGQSEDEIRTYMKDTYFASDEKIELSLAVAKRELELLSRIDYENGYSLYVGIPFCPSTCLYCSFTSYPLAKWANRMDEYLDALEKEIVFTAEACKDKVLNSVYIGGGTPTTLSAEQMDRLLTMIGKYFGIADEQGRMIYADDALHQTTDRAECKVDGYANAEQEISDLKNQNVDESGQQKTENAGADKHKHTQLLEFTVEAGRPDSITREKLEVIRRHNISRISINPQTMKEETLRLIGRQHTVQQTIDSFKLARKVGFDNINMDLIVGLPGEHKDDVEHTLKEIQALDPDSLTIHSLAVKRAARLRMFKDQYEEMGFENNQEIMEMAMNYARSCQMGPYYLYRQKNMCGNLENVGYAKVDKAGIYNILIMEEKQTIIAAGAGASTKLVSDHGQKIERIENVKDVTNYITRIDEMIERKRDGIVL